MAFKPNRRLLNVHFEGYKLSAAPATSSQIKLPAGVFQAKLKDGDFSFHHVKAFTLHNHLIADPYNESGVYWCSKDGCIQRGKGVVSFSYKPKFV